MEMASLWQLAQILGMIILAALFVIMIKADVRVLRVQMDGITENLKILNNSFSKLSDVLSEAAVQNSRIARAEEDIRELRHGRGFVRNGIEGEWGSGGKVDR
jgi:cell division protein FtsL